MIHLLKIVLKTNKIHWSKVWNNILLFKKFFTKLIQKVTASALLIRAAKISNVLPNSKNNSSELEQRKVKYISRILCFTFTFSVTSE